MQKNTLSISKERQHAWSQTKKSAYQITKNKAAGIGLTRQSAVFGGILGEIIGAVIGTATGALTMNLTGILMGFTAGILLGALTGLIIGMAISKTAGTSGGASIGAYTGMGLGPVLGTIFGLMIPDSIRMGLNAQHLPLLNVLTASRFETISLFAFLLCILGTMVGVWVSGKNYAPEKSIR